RSARSLPHWFVKSPPWAARYLLSFRRRSRRASRPNFADILGRSASCGGGANGYRPLSLAFSPSLSGVFMIRAFAFVLALVFAVPAIPVPVSAQSLPAGLDKQNAIVIDTTKGRIVIKLRTDLAPQHAERIKQLAREGFYNNVPFHRVMDGFMAQ